MPHLLRRIAIFTLLFAGLALPTAAQAGPSKGVVRSSFTGVKAHISLQKARATRECANADLMPAPGNEGLVRAAVLCLHNQIRAGRGLPLLRENAKLRRAAAGHSADMVTRSFFDHTAPGGATFVQRIFAARYASRRVAWSLGENLAWGTGSLATPRATVRAWMNSPGHRANILNAGFREIGIGIAHGAPVHVGAAARGATYATDFGRRG
jgi:uncharacterized protein YkwD